MKDYHKLEQLIEAQAIKEGLKDVREGKVIDGEKAIKKIKEKYHI